MTDTSRTAVAEGEAPVNPYSLLAAVNSSSDTAHTGWLIFIGIMSYVLIAVAGVTHKDLLLSADIPLPVLQVRIDLTRFFLFAPIVVVLIHVGVVSQLVLLARKTLEFDNAIRILEISDKRTHPLRLELHNFFFVQALAGPERSRVMSVFLHGLSWLTLVVLPVVLLLYVQVVFLPYHDLFITWAHRIALAADVAMLTLIGIFLTRPETSIFSAVARLVVAHPVTVALTTAILTVVMAFSWFAATIPGEPLDRMGRAMSGLSRPEPFPANQAAYGFVLPFLGQRDDGTLFGIFERNLNVTDLDLVVDKDVTLGEPTVILRGRDLRFARLDRTDLHQADLTGANLEGASLVGADLRGALLQCADVNQLVLTENRGAARCPTARGANLTRARLKEARMAGIDLRNARLEDADLEGAELTYANMAGAVLYGAHLERADVTGGVLLAGANFGTASLQGADLTGAKLHGADFTSAGLQGAVLAHAYLQGAVLRDADLEGADLYKARLHGADLRGARLKAATLREAVVWRTRPPSPDHVDLADLSELSQTPPGDADLIDQASLGRMEGDRAPGQVKDALAVLVSADGRTGWTGSGDAVAWASLVSATAAGMQDAYKPRLTAHLAQLACKSRWANGSVATGVARRALSIEYKGDLGELYDRIRAESCPAAKTMSRRALRSLATAVDILRGN